MDKKKYLVKVWEKHAVSFEVEAENEKDAKKNAREYFGSDVDMQWELLDDDKIESEGVEVLKCIGGANE